MPGRFSVRILNDSELGGYRQTCLHCFAATVAGYGNDNIIETSRTTIVSLNLAILQVEDDNKSETGHLAPLLSGLSEVVIFAVKLSVYGLWSALADVAVLDNPETG